MKTIKSERVYLNRFDVVLAVGEIGLEGIDGYDHAVDAEVVEGEVDVGMPLQAVADAVRSARRENEREAVEARRTEERSAREAKCEAERTAARDSVLAALKSLVQSAEWDGGCAKVVLADVESEGYAMQLIWVAFELSDLAARSRIVVGSYKDDVSRFPLNKQGSFNFDRVARSIVEKARVRAAREKRETETKSRRHSSASIARQLHDACGLREYDSEVGVGSCDYDASKVKVSVSMVLTQEDAAELLQVAARIRAEREAREEADRGAAAAAEGAAILA